jgi:serine/threonine protein kinase
MDGVDGAKLMGDDTSSDPLVGQTINERYRVVGRLATGLTGPVYLAQQISTGATVALKVLQGEYSRDERFVRRFRQLMLAVATLSEHHDNIVKVLDCEQAEEGRLFIAMEYLKGRPLSDVIRQEGPLEIKRALFLAQQMAEGLSAAHAAGIIHTDVRPENFILVGEEGTVKLIGFEQARVSNDEAFDSLVGSEVVPRSPDYLAPEQIEGKEITRQTDIYALGVVLYQMLTGLVPFKAPTPKAVLEMHLQEAPVPLRDLRPEIPEVLEAKVLQALEKEPERRESYANDVVNESLYELVLEDMQAEPFQEEEQGLIGRSRVALHAALGGAQSIATKFGNAGGAWNLPAISPIRVALNAAIGAARNIATKHRNARVRWKLAVIFGLLILLAVQLWMVNSRKTPEVPATPSTRQNPEAARSTAPAIASQPEGKVAETPTLASQDLQGETVKSSPETPPLPSASQGMDKSIEKKYTSAQKQRKAKSPRNSRVLVAPRREVPAAAPQHKPPESKGEPQDASPDPGDAIDWVLKHR